MRTLILTVIILVIALFTGCSGLHTLPESADRPINVSFIRASTPNSVGGVDINIYWTNTSDKIVKYASFNVEAYNEVGDPVMCTVRRESVRGLLHTGPTDPGHPRGILGTSGVSSWENILYNHSVYMFRLVEIRVEYMDGEVITINGDDLSIRYTQSQLDLRREPVW